MPDIVAKAMAVIMGMLLLGTVAILYVTSRPPSGTQQIVAEFRDAFPTVEGFSVRSNGAPVGSVGKTGVNAEGLATVTLLVDKETPEPRADAKATIRQFDSTGSALGAQFKVDGTSSYGFNPKVAADASGNFVVVWGEYQDAWPVFARRFDASGMPHGAQFQVNTYTTGCCGYSIVDEDFDAVEVAADAAGRFMVIWTRESPATTGVFGRLRGWAHRM